MGKYLESVKALVEEYKPRLEEKFNISIGNMEVFPYKNLCLDLIESVEKEVGKKCSTLEKAIAYCLIKLPEDFTSMTVGPKENKVYVNDSVLAQLQTSKKDTKETVMHELGHKVEESLNKKDIKDKEVKKAFNEGFAEYVTYEFPELYGEEKTKKTKGFKRKIVRSPTAYILEAVITFGMMIQYRRGYRFWHKVTDKLGKENLDLIFENPPQSMEEILEPEKYLERIEGGGK